jgi:hypothetical protein
MFFIFLLGSGMFVLGAGCCSSSEDGELKANIIAVIDERSTTEERIIDFSRESVNDLRFRGKHFPINCRRRANEFYFLTKSVLWDFTCSALIHLTNKTAAGR